MKQKNKLNSFAKFLLTISIISLPLLSSASDYHIHKNDDASLRLFTTYESNGNDYISGFGSGITVKNKDTNIGFQLNTSLNNAEVLTTDGYIEDYFAWQGSAKFGLFSSTSLYAEAGIDLTELFFHDLRDDNDGYHDEHNDDIDAFVGVGAGVQTGPLKIEAFARLRAIDSEYWQAESSVFTGIQLSINF